MPEVRIPVTLAKCRRCGGPLVAKKVARPSEHWLMICRHDEVAAVVPAWMEPHLEELEYQQTERQALRVL